jgi:hypothetical protein
MAIRAISRFGLWHGIATWRRPMWSKPSGECERQAGDRGDGTLREAAVLNKHDVVVMAGAMIPNVCAKN